MSSLNPSDPVDENALLGSMVKSGHELMISAQLSSTSKIDPDKLKPNVPHLVGFMMIMLLSGCAQNYYDYSNAAEALYDA